MNPMIAIMQMMKGGGSPQAVIQQMMGNNAVMSNPMARNAIDMLQKGNMEGLQEMANNLARERNTTIEEVKNSIMKQFGM